MGILQANQIIGTQFAGNTEEAVLGFQMPQCFCAGNRMLYALWEAGAF